MVILSNLDLYFNVIYITFISFDDDINFINVILGGIALFSIAYYYLIKWKKNGSDDDNSKSLAYYRAEKKDINN